MTLSEIENGVGWLVVLVQTRLRAAALTKMGIIAKHSGDYSAKWNFAPPSRLGVPNHMLLNEGVVDFRAEFGAVAVGLSLLGSARTRRNSPRRMRRKQMEFE